MTALFESLSFQRGPSMKNRFMLAPLTNSQSHEDGVLSEEEFHWLTMRAKGGFGLTMTCAAQVQAVGKGFPGQGSHFTSQFPIAYGAGYQFLTCEKSSLLGTSEKRGAMRKVY